MQPVRPKKSSALALFLLALAPPARAANYYVSPTGSDSGGGTEASPWKSIGKGAAAAQPGDTVYLRGGTYTSAVWLTRSGTSSAWITFASYPGELAIIQGTGTGGSGFASSTAEYIRVVGIAVRSWAYSGFSNGWVNDTGTSNGNWQFIQCIAENNGVNGIAFYNASNVLVDQSIVLHNGNQQPSWSSGVNLFHVAGGAAANVVRRTVSFENVDISSNHSDGSGFILDQNSDGATFENNLGFRNGGSCIRLTNSPGARIVNNTCWHNAMDPQTALGQPASPGEILFSDSNSKTGVTLVNNLAAASGHNGTQSAFVNAPSGTNNVTVNANGATPFFVNPAALDFRLVAGSSTVIDQASVANAPSTDIGFDPKCVKAQSGQSPSFWQYNVDYDYVRSVGGVAGCFRPTARPQGSAPDIGAYEYGTTTPGCSAPADCNDGDVCTTDTCTGGQCGHAAVANCCTSAGQCNDDNACTTDTCSGNQCGHAAIAGCCLDNAGCNDGDACTADSCNLGTHRCTNAGISGCCTDDGDCAAPACATASCDTGENECRTEPIAGCCTANTDCDDDNPCTADSCETDEGECENAPIANCCATDGDCDDDDGCTTDRCDGGSNRCENDAVSGCCSDDDECDDGVACSVDTCSGNRCAHAMDACGGGGMSAGGTSAGGMSGAGGTAAGGAPNGGTANGGTANGGTANGGTAPNGGMSAGGTANGGNGAVSGAGGSLAQGGASGGAGAASATGGRGGAASNSGGALAGGPAAGGTSSEDPADYSYDTGDAESLRACNCRTPGRAPAEPGGFFAMAGLILLLARRSFTPRRTPNR